MTETICPECQKKWPGGSEQAAAVRIYKKCIVCCVAAEKDKGFAWFVKEVVEEQRSFVGRFGRN